MTRVRAALVALLLIALPAEAHGQQTNPSSGNSAIDEYLETVPWATGDRRPVPPGAVAVSGAGILTPAQRARLERLGSDGRVLADAVDATSFGGTRPDARVAPPSVAQGDSSLGGVLAAAIGRGGGGVAGAVLPAILLGALCFAVVRRSAS